MDGYRALGLGGTAAVGSYVGEAEARWMVLQGAEPQTAAIRATTAVFFRWLFGVFAAQWLLIWWVVAWLLIPSTVESLFRYIIGWETPTTWDGLTAQGWQSFPTDGGERFYFVWSGLGSAAAFGMVYGIFLVFAHIWRWETKCVPGLNDGKAWWRLYRKPKDIYPPHGVRATLTKILKVGLVYIPAVAIPLWVMVGFLPFLTATVAHNV